MAFGEAVSKGVLPAALTSELYMVVALSMAMVPYLAALGGKLGVLFEKSGMHTAAWGSTQAMCRSTFLSCFKLCLCLPMLRVQQVHVQGVDCLATALAHDLQHPVVCAQQRSRLIMV